MNQDTQFDPSQEPKVFEVKAGIQKVLEAIPMEDKLFRKIHDAFLKQLLQLLKDKSLLRALKKATSTDQVRQQNVYILKETLQEIQRYEQQQKKQAEARDQVFNKAKMGIRQQLQIQGRLEKVKPPIFYLNNFKIERTDRVISARQRQISLFDLQKRVENINLRQKNLLLKKKELGKLLDKLRQTRDILSSYDMVLAAKYDKTGNDSEVA